MDNIKFDKIQQKKIWKAMIEAGVIEDKPQDKSLAKKQYNLKTRLKNTNEQQTTLMMKTVLFFYDKYDVMRKHYRQKLREKDNIIDDLESKIERLQKQNGSLQSNVKSLKKTLLAESEANHKYKTANKVLNQRLDEKNNNIEVKPDVVAEKIDCYGMSACIVKGESVSSDDEINYDE